MNPVTSLAYSFRSQDDGTTVAYARSDAAMTIDMFDLSGVKCELITLFISTDDGGGPQVTTETILAAIDADLAAYNASIGG